MTPLDGWACRTTQCANDTSEQWIAFAGLGRITWRRVSPCVRRTGVLRAEMQDRQEFRRMTRMAHKGHRTRLPPRPRLPLGMPGSLRIAGAYRAVVAPAETRGQTKAVPRPAAEDACSTTNRCPPRARSAIVPSRACRYSQGRLSAAAALQAAVPRQEGSKRTSSAGVRKSHFRKELPNRCPNPSAALAFEY